MKIIFLILPLFLFATHSRSMNKITSKKEPQETNLNLFLIGSWQLDSVEMPLDDNLRSSLKYMKNTFLRNNIVVVHYQKKYSKNGDNIWIEEYKADGTINRITKDFFSSQKDKNNTPKTRYLYRIDKNVIVQSLIWGSNKTISRNTVLKIDAQNLVYSGDVDGTKNIFYFSRLK